MKPDLLSLLLEEWKPYTSRPYGTAFKVGNIIFFVFTDEFMSYWTPNSFPQYHLATTIQVGQEKFDKRIWLYPDDELDSSDPLDFIRQTVARRYPVDGLSSMEDHFIQDFFYLTGLSPSAWLDYYKGEPSYACPPQSLNVQWQGPEELREKHRYNLSQVFMFDYD